MTSGGRRRAMLAGLGVLLFALVVRLVVFELATPERVMGDEGYYVGTAIHLAEGRGHGQDDVLHARWPPAYPFLLAQFVDLELAAEQPYPTAMLQRLMRVNLVLGALLALAILALACELFDLRTGVVAGLLAGVYPNFVGYSHYLWAETLFLLTMVGGLALALRARRTGSRWEIVAAGVCFGVSALTREVALPVAGMTALWWFWSARRGERLAGLLRGALLVGVSVATVLPWTWRNWELYERVVPVSTVAWMGIREGNTLQPDWMEQNSAELNAFRSQYHSFEDDLERVDFARAQSYELIRREQPWWALKKLVRTTALLFTPDSFVFKKVSRGSYGEVGLGGFRAVLVATVMAYLAIMSLGTLGALGTRREGRRILFALIFAAVFLLQAFAQAKSRYRLPLMPIFVAYAAHSLVVGPQIWSESSRAVRVGVVVALGTLFGFCLPYFWADAVSLWDNATYVDPRRP